MEVLELNELLKLPAREQEFYVQKIRSLTEDFLKKERISQSALGKAIGKRDGSALSSFRKGEYKGKNLELAHDLELYIKNYLVKKQIKGKVTTEQAETGSVFASKDKKMAELVIDIAVDEKEMGIVYGSPGTGKSVIASEYTKSHPNAILIEATLHTTAKTLLGILSEKLRLQKSSNLDENVRLIAKELFKRDAVLLIDEGEHLPIKALEDLRRIQDFSSVPVILFGTQILMKNLLGKNGELAQLSSRIGSRYEMRGLDEAECQSFFGEHIFTFTKGNFRKSAKLKKRVAKLALHGGDPRDRESVMEAAKMMFL
ncbi:hypothetical protein BKH41_02700 [Helicobacter sp. 12S02232-10]|nr:hypothetical protein BKH41_02700 [Helicobacter sp. 12S02232-10]